MPLKSFFINDSNMKVVYKSCPMHLAMICFYLTSDWGGGLGKMEFSSLKGKSSDGYQLQVSDSLGNQLLDSSALICQGVVM